MFIENLNVTELGVFQKVEMEFCNDKINIIQGPNGCGKNNSTCNIVFYATR